MSTATETSTGAGTATEARETITQVDPRTLVIAANVRGTVEVGREFVASIRDLGVLEPVTAVREGEELRVRYGQRRTLGAVQAGVATIPVRVIDAGDDQALRIVAQMAENDHRAGISTGDRRAAYEQLTGLGLSAAQIAKRTHRPKEEVSAATTASASQVATQALSAHHDVLSLLDAAAIAEFEANDQVVSAIVQAAREGESTAHVIQEARDDRAAQSAYDLTAACLRDKGHRVIDRPDYGSPITVLSQVMGTRDATRAVSEAEHETCPGHAVYLQRSYMRGGDAAYSPVYVCTDPKGNGHTVSDPYGRASTGGAMGEEQKAERRTVIANNKAWDAAQQVRADWLASFAKGTGKLTEAERFIARAVTRGECPPRTWAASPEAVKIDRMGPTAAIRHTVAVILGTWHENTSRTTWRTPDAQDARMLGAMIAWGYTPGPVEKLLLPKAAKKATANARTPRATA